VSVALRNDDALHGTIIIFRQEVRPFSDKEIRLLQNFAAQAVIAIENARLLTETREALDQQTATAEILQVINSSPGDLSPVFDAILEKAHILCDVAHGSLTTYDGQHFRGVALRGVPQRFGDLLRQPRPPYPGGTQERLLQGERLIHIPDIAADEPTPPVRRASVEAGARTLLMVPLRKDNTLLGYISAHRREVRPFSDKQIALLQNFAAQAVIAMENARLLNELRQRTSDLTESLQQQTATSEVLSIISSSPGELAPVFQTMLENAVRICEAKFGNLFLIDGDGCHWSAGVDTPRKLAEYFTQRKTFQPTLGSHLDRVMRTKQVSHSADDTAEEVVGAAARLAGARSTVCVPMLKDEALVGAIFIYRTEIRPFTDKQIELLENFAAQAVIAIENARLLNELRQRTDDLGEALEQQTATSEVLKVISSSPGELEPVFQAMLENATRICEAKFGILYRFDGQEFYFAADVGTPHEFADFLRRRGPFRPPPGTNLDLLLQTLDVVRIADDSAGPAPGAAARVASARSVISVPMLKENALIGAITIFRQEVRPFTDKQVELVKNFAAQAVIAIENTRLLNELRESLQQQMATAQVLSVISSSPGQLEPVFQSMLENATRICEAKFGTLYRFDGEKFHLGAQHGTPAELAEFQMRRGAFTPRPGNLLDVVMRTKRLCRTADYAAEPVSSVVTMLGGARSTVAVPMLKDEELIGVIVIYRQEVRPFTDKQIALVQNFAAQAVIAIENARLLNELRQRTDDLAESLEEQTATSEVLKVISSSPGDLEPVFRAMLLNATRICEAKFGTMFLRDDDVFRFAAEVGTPAALAEYNMQRKALVPTPGSTIGKVMHTSSPPAVSTCSA
jgi:GAF domain-containing protein